MAKQDFSKYPKHNNAYDIGIEKALPSNIEAERYILGAIILENQNINLALEQLKPDDYFLAAHRKIYEKMQKLTQEDRAIDPLTLQEELRRAGELDMVGGAAYIASLFEGVPRFSKIENYIQIVKDRSLLRKLIIASNHIMTLCFDDEEEARQIVDKAAKEILSLSEEGIKKGFEHISVVAERQLEIIEMNSGRNEVITGLSTGFHDLDYMTTGLQRGDLLIIAARPSMGKCLAADSEILLEDGSIATIEDIYRKKDACLLTLGDDYKFSKTNPSAYIDDGIKPVCRVTTKLGRYVDSTLTHPYLTINGWKPLSEIQAGTRIAVPRVIDVFGNEEIESNKITALADKSYANEVPSFVYRLKKTQLALFLNRLFATDRAIVVNTGSLSQIKYTSISERLVRQLQHLLLRFGIIGSVRKKEATNNNLHQISWQLEITDEDSIFLFEEEIGFKQCLEEKVELIAGSARVPAGMISPNRELARIMPARTRALPAISSALGTFISNKPIFLDSINTALSSISDVYWDEIVSIEYLGNKHVYDLTIPETHNFVANDICVHNTAFSLNIAQNAALKQQVFKKQGEKAVIGFFSLEMSNEQLVSRLLCSNAAIDAHRLRTGMLNKENWKALAKAVGELSEAKIFLDDTPGISTIEMRAKCRRLKHEQKGLDLVIVDYLQLMSGRGRTESRQLEVSQISRDLKILAKELDVPLIALSQLSRAPEARTGNHRPQLSDLRDSGCLAGESLITSADTGEQIPIRDLVGKSGFRVWALNEQTMKIESAVVSNAFSTGIKPVYKLTTRLGRTIRTTANHKFRAFGGWKRLDEFVVGDHMALPRVIDSPYVQTMTDAELALLGHLIGDGCTLPKHAIQYTTNQEDLAEIVAALAKEVFGNDVEPRIKKERQWYQVYLKSTRKHTHNVHSAIADWLTELGVWGLRSYEKRIPEKLFQQPKEAIAKFLKHLWVTDGCIKMKPGFYPPAIYYASSSADLTFGVQSLLLRLGINSWLRRVSQNGKGRDQYHVVVTGKPDIERFIQQVSTVGTYKTNSLQEISGYIKDKVPNTNRDIIPNAAWREIIVPAYQKLGLTTRSFQQKIDVTYCGSSLYKHNLSRERAFRVADVVCSDPLKVLANSDVYWDQVLSIEPDSETEVFDLTVPGPHNFIAGLIFSHNSLEQDADVVMFIYRDEVYKPESEKQGMAEIIIGKQRNGPIGSVELVFIKEQTKFADKV